MRPGQNDPRVVTFQIDRSNTRYNRTSDCCTEYAPSAPS